MGGQLRWAFVQSRRFTERITPLRLSHENADLRVWIQSVNWIYAAINSRHSPSQRYRFDRE